MCWDAAVALCKAQGRLAAWGWAGGEEAWRCLLRLARASPPAASWGFQPGWSPHWPAAPASSSQTRELPPLSTPLLLVTCPAALARSSQSWTPWRAAACFAMRWTSSAAALGPAPSCCATRCVHGSALDLLGRACPPAWGGDRCCCMCTPHPCGGNAPVICHGMAPCAVRARVPRGLPQKVRQVRAGCGARG